MDGIWMMFYVAQFNDPRVNLILALLDRKKKSQRWLATKIGASHYSVGKWLNPSAGNQPRDTSIYNAMLDVLKESPQPDGFSVKTLGMREVVVYMAGLPGGPPESVVADTETIMFPYSGDPTDELYGRPIKGDSMADALLSGDVGIFVVQDETESGDVVHMAKAGQEAVKCRRTIDGEPWAYSFNSEFEPFDCRGWTPKGLCVGRVRNGPFNIRQYTEFPGGLKWSMRTIGL